MWPILIGIGAYLIATGIQEAIKENQVEQKALLAPDTQTCALPTPEVTESDSVSDTELQHYLQNLPE